MGQHERRALGGLVPVLIFILLSGCAKRPTAVTMSAPPPSGHAEQIATAAPQEAPAAVSGTAETPRVEVETSQPPSPEAGAPEAPAQTPAAAAPAEEAVTTPSEPSTAPPAAEAPATVAAPTPSAPAAVPAVTPATPEEFRPADGLRAIHFDFDKYAIRREDARMLDENATWLKANEDYLILIEGHADERGTSEYNIALGSHRAKATMDYLVGLGVQRSRMTVVSYGKERPLCVQRTEECWARNRRAQFLIKPREGADGAGEPEKGTR